MSGYYNDSKRMQLCTALIEIKTILNNWKTRLNALKDSDNISINYKKALIKGLLLLELYIKYVDRQTNNFSVNDPQLIAFVLDFRNPNFITHLAGEDQMVIQNVITRGSTVASKGATTVSTAVSDTIASALNSTDPITQVAISRTFDGTQPANSDYYKNGYSFGNVPYYGSKTTFTLDSENNITILSDGDPYPSLAGTPNFTNNGTAARTFGIIKSYFVEQWYDYTFPYRGGTNTDANNVVFYEVSSEEGMGIQGIFANGTALYNPSSGFSVPSVDVSAGEQGGTNYAFNAIFFENQYGIDDAGGHPSPGGMPNSENVKGQYHYHDSMFSSPDASNAWNNSIFLNSNTYYGTTNYNGDYLRHSDGHSKIIAVLFDGYPIYGPYGYSTATDASSGVILMTSSYTTRSTIFDGRPYSYTDIVYATDGTPIEMSAGAYLNDYYYVDGLGILDVHNGRYCVTPEYPNGTYAYFATMDESGDPVFPYFVGQYSRQSLKVINNGYNGK